MTALNTFIGRIETNIINPLVTLLALAAFVMFIWGVVEYVRNAANDEARKTGTQHILWGIVGLAIVFGAVAIVNILRLVINLFT